MRFAYPAGLWALGAGLILLIILFLIRPPFQDYPVSTTYLWKLSEKFRKKRLPIRRAKKILLLLLQALCVAAAALLIAQPSLPMPGSGKDWIAVIDISGSMTAMEEGTSRLEKAKSEVLRRAASLERGSAVTLITAGASPEVLLLQGRDQAEVRRALDRVASDWSEAATDEALVLAGNAASNCQDAEITLYTDMDYLSASGLTVENVASGSRNAAIPSLTCSMESGYAHFSAELVYYDPQDGSQDDPQDDPLTRLTVALYVDGKLIGAKTVDVALGNTSVETTVLDWPVRDIRSFVSARMVLSVEDAIAQDNEAWCLAPPTKNVKVLLASDTPFYWEHALSALPEVDLTVTEAASASLTSGGYDLYIFDGSAPDPLPSDGSVWLSAVRSAPRDTGLRLNELVRGGSLASSKTMPAILCELTTGLSLRDVTVQRLVSTQETERFAAVLTAGGKPALLAAQEADGRWTMMLTFDVHNSNLPLTADFVILLRNMLRFCVPDMLTARVFTCGDTVEASVLPMATALYLQHPDGRMTSLSADGRTASFQLNQPGVWTLLASRGAWDDRYCDFVARFPGSESDTRRRVSPTALLVSRREAAVDETLLSETEENRSDTRMFLAALLLLFLVTEWVVYHHEQY